ncbi:hypothetical protein FACS189476_02430 [Spirochaetia bacterium]|nr:hypothetical protein FACS189476_02430 [Spirochaetia bacterium]
MDRGQIPRPLGAAVEDQDFFGPKPVQFRRHRPCGAPRADNGGLLSFKIVLFFIIFIGGAAPALWPQETAGGADDPSALIGLTLEALLNRFGIPQSVYAVRGLEDWQDDVVFVYQAGDFYVFRDRVWQIGLKSAYGIRVGDPRAAVELALGDKAEVFEDHFLLSLPGKAWPLMLRVNLSGPAGAGVSALFIYRPDF